MGKNPEARKRKRLRRAVHRKERLAQADTTGWRKCTDFHFQKTILGRLVNWYPSGQKCTIESPPQKGAPEIERKTYRVSDEFEIIQIIREETEATERKAS